MKDETAEFFEIGNNNNKKVLTIAALFGNKLFFKRDCGVAFTLDSLVVGVAPRLTGVAGGMFLSIYSGEI